MEGNPHTVAGWWYNLNALQEYSYDHCMSKCACLNPDGVKSIIQQIEETVEEAINRTPINPGEADNGLLLPQDIHWPYGSPSPIRLTDAQSIAIGSAHSALRHYQFFRLVKAERRVSTRRSFHHFSLDPVQNQESGFPIRQISSRRSLQMKLQTMLCFNAVIVVVLIVLSGCKPGIDQASIARRRMENALANVGTTGRLYLYDVSLADMLPNSNFGKKGESVQIAVLESCIATSSELIALVQSFPNLKTVVFTGRITRGEESYGQFAERRTELAALAISTPKLEAELLQMLVDGTGTHMLFLTNGTEITEVEEVQHSVLAPLKKRKSLEIFCDKRSAYLSQPALSQLGYDTNSNIPSDLDEWQTLALVTRLLEKKSGEKSTISPENEPDDG